MEEYPMADKKYALNFTSGEIVNVSIYKSTYGYNYASIGIKKGKDQFMNINYEWEGDMTPDFVMDMIGYFGMKEEASVEAKAEFKEFMKRFVESTEVL
jgi:hypothetical protein